LRGASSGKSRKTRRNARELDERNLNGWAIRLLIDDLLGKARAEAEFFGASSP
jgi:hypothetical protein